MTAGEARPVSSPANRIPPDGPAQAGVARSQTRRRGGIRVVLDGVWRVDVETGVDAITRRPIAPIPAGWGSVSCSATIPPGTRPWRPNLVTKRLIRARRDAGLAHVRLHDLRHFMATQMLAAGVPIATVSQRLSHARASTTLNVYAHAVPSGDRDAAETLATILTAGQPHPSDSTISS